MSRALARRLAPLDRLTVLYLIVAMSVLAAHFTGWHRGLPYRWETLPLALAHVLLMLVALLAPTARAQVEGRRCSFVAEWYPLVVMAGLYATVGLLNDKADVGFDPMVQQWELLVFGRQISYEWIRAMPSPLLSWVLHLSYLAFYPLVFAAPLGLWLTRRRAAARDSIYIVSFAFFVCYLVFLLFPVAGPPYLWEWPDNAATTVWPARIVHTLLRDGDAWGSAFPSSHVAVSVVATVSAFRGWRALGWVLLVPTVGILFAVVYGQIHYGVDAIAGLALGALICVARPRV